MGKSSAAFNLLKIGVAVLGILFLSNRYQNRL